MVGVVDTDSNMDVCDSPALVDELFSSDEHKCAEAIGELRSILIGSNRQKQLVIERGVVPRLINFIAHPSQTQQLRVGAAFALCSLAKGGESSAKALIDADVVPALITGLDDPDSRVVEACLCCLRTLCQYPEAPADLLLSQPRTVEKLVALTQNSVNNKIAVASIIADACKTKEHQDVLSNSPGLLASLHSQLLSQSWHVQLPSLKALGCLCSKNDVVAAQICRFDLRDECHDEDEEGGADENLELLELIVSQLDRGSRHPEMLLAATKCITNIYRCGFIEDKDMRIVYKTLPCLVRLVKKPLALPLRVEAADTLAELIEVSGFLQRVAAISDHLVDTMASFIGFSTSSVDARCAAFRVFAALAANDEDIRKRVASTDNLMSVLLSDLEENSENTKLTLAAISCLHSLSRSVQLLRTTFQDFSAWKPLMHMMSGESSVETMVKASSALCNLVLEFSPSKQFILDLGAVEMFTDLTHRAEPSLRLNALWALMNLAFDADEGVKVEIMTSMGSDQMFRLLYDSHDAIVIKTLGLLRNLLASKQHVDHIMIAHGREVMQAIVMILESDRSPDVKEQALCILTNIGAGESAKSFIMSNEDVLKKLANYMMHHSSKLQMAAVFCVHNLVCNDDDRGNAQTRRQKLREMGVHKILQQIQLTATQLLCERVKEALLQLSSP